VDPVEETIDVAELEALGLELAPVPAGDTRE
jgi:hypothetical protein